MQSTKLSEEGKVRTDKLTMKGILKGCMNMSKWVQELTELYSAD